MDPPGRTEVGVPPLAQAVNLETAATRISDDKIPRGWFVGIVKLEQQSDYVWRCQVYDVGAWTRLATSWRRHDTSPPVRDGPDQNASSNNHAPSPPFPFQNCLGHL